MLFGTTHILMGEPDMGIYGTLFSWSLGNKEKQTAAHFLLLRQNT